MTAPLLTARVVRNSRRFIQIFRDEVGLTPKLLCRVLRFQEVINTIEKRDAVDWVDIALSCGYFDQAHFIHDFRSFAGITPTGYQAGKTQFRNHVKFLQSPDAVP